MIHVIAFTDGSAMPNGDGGWACALATADGRWTERSGCCMATTCNRMELTAVLMVLRELPDHEPVCIVTDSQWVLQGATEWRHSWKVRGWRNSKRKPTAHLDLWVELDTILATREVVFVKVAAHRGIPPNERCDELASAAAAAARNSVAA